MVVLGAPHPSPISLGRKMFTILLMIASKFIPSFGLPFEPICTKYTDPKLRIFDGRVIVKYAYHQTLENDNVLKGLIRQAARIYEKQTCVRWIETKITDPCHKVVILKESYCKASLNYHDQYGVLIFLDPTCYTLEVLLHEMMHSLGIRHTHQRPDRDKYVRVWEGSIIPKYYYNFEIHPLTNTYGVPYDYQSIMHYDRWAFKSGNLYTMTPTDSLALFTMGKRQKKLRWSDTAMVNHHLGCVANLPTTCPEEVRPNCKNGGYVLHTCKCSCPENRKGKECEIDIDIPLYDEEVKCGGIVKEDKIISTPEFDSGKAPEDPCVFQILAKKCYQAHIEFLRVEMPGSTCFDNVLAMEVSGTLRTYCQKTLVPMDREIFFRTRKAAIHFYMGRDFPEQPAGFQARITFHQNTTWPRGKEMLESVHNCYLTTHGRYYEFRTPFFPSPVACFALCSTIFYYDMNGKENGFMRLELQQKLKSSEELIITDRTFRVTITQSSPKSLIRSVQMPVTIKFKGTDNPGNGFAINMFQRGEEPCVGERFFVGRTGLKMMNPIFNKNLTNCYMRFIATRGKHLYFNLEEIEGDSLYIGSLQSEGRYRFVKYKSSDVRIHLETRSAVLYYEPSGPRRNWKLVVTLELCFYKPYELFLLGRSTAWMLDNIPIR